MTNPDTPEQATCPTCGGTVFTPGPSEDYNPETEPAPPLCSNPFHDQTPSPADEAEREQRWTIYRDVLGGRTGDWRVSGLPLQPGDPYREVVEVAPLSELTTLRKRLEEEQERAEDFRLWIERIRETTNDPRVRAAVREALLGGGPSE